MKLLKVAGIVIICIGCAAVFLLIPLDNPKFKINFDQEKINIRKRFLDQLQPQPDSIPKLNYIIILADDLGKTDLSHYGNTYVETPHIDSIGIKGVTFTNGYITSPICAPSRAGLLTGRYQQRFGFELQPHNRYPRNRLELYGFKYLVNTGNWLVTDSTAFPTLENILDQGIPPSEILLSEIMQKSGYHTGAVGKWHLGYSATSFPNNRGFDFHYGFYEAYSLYSDTNNANIVNQRHHFDFSDRYIWEGARKGNCAIRRNHKQVNEKVYLTSAIANEACKFIEEHKDSAFFLYVPFSAPHTPFQATKDHYDELSHIQDRNKRVYYAMIAALDDAVGQIMKTVADARLDSNTVVFFLSDNGGATYTRATENAPLKGGKFTNFEGGLNVPFMMKWPGSICPNTIIDDPVLSTDIFATIIDLAGISLPKDRKYDGSDLLSILRDPSPKDIRSLYWRSGYNSAIRQGKWKLIIDDFGKTTSLYELKSDKSETRNMAGTLPRVVEELRKDIQSWEEGLINPQWPKVMDYRYTDKDGVNYYFPL